ncbi:EAL domain-containing response regulator [Shewanella electrodiphila]|uniref:EAL domain-containing response regulator n=1 Tax=Shewanella electrodiphila TaxID=934143 RepID=A0ABT0KML2_9GAMM|nr:EAL domain-containing response regulator [Shewanella electrodiphila]
MAKEIRSILIVDDQSIIRKIFIKSLQLLGEFDISEAADGLDAFNLIKTCDFDMVFCDLNMPVKDGLYLLERLIEIKYTSPIVLFSGEDENLLNSAKVLASHYHLNILSIVPKPITSMMLKSLIKQASSLKTFTVQEPLLELTQEQLQFHLKQGNVKAYFQPQYNLNTNQVSGFEALARIVDGDNVILPSQFINAAENTGLILPLTKAVITDAFENFSKLNNTFSSLNLSINLSGKILVDDTLPQWIESTASANAIANSAITCELTETAIPSNPSIMIVALLRLRMMKFKLSIDDFGTGFASLEQLHMLPFDELKIDRCFVSDILNNTKSQALFRRSISLANDLDLLAVAEGVEDYETKCLIQQLGCSIAQGFFFSKPLPANDVVNKINQLGLGFGAKEEVSPIEQK